MRLAGADSPEAPRGHTALQELATDADALYVRLREAADEYDPGLVEPADGIFVLHCGDDNLAMVDVLGTVWSDGNHWSVEAHEPKEEVERLLVAQEEVEPT